MILFRSQTYRITEAIGGGSQIVGQRCRLILSAQEEEIKPATDGFLYDLQAFMLSGKQAESTIELPPCRVKPISTRNCSCKAYPFPHAPGFGKCKSPRKEEAAPDGLDLDKLFPGVAK